MEIGLEMGRMELWYSVDGVVKSWVVVVGVVRGYEWDGMQRGGRRDEGEGERGKRLRNGWCVASEARQIGDERGGRGDLWVAGSIGPSIRWRGTRCRHYYSH